MKYDASAIQTMVCQTTGTLHTQSGLSCQDAISVQTFPDLLFYGLADGQSGKSRGAEGGKASLERLAGYIRSRGIESMTRSPFPDELPCMLMQQVRQSLLALAENQSCDFSEYASTLLAIAIDPNSGDYILLHLGDGCFLGIGAEGSLSLLSRPESGLTRHHTWLTTASHAVSHFRVSFGNLNGLRRLVLLSDGAERLCQGMHIPRRAKELLCAGSAADIRQYLHARPGTDDASCILLDLPCAISPETK